MRTLNKNIVIMGGSFNPPTLAHYMLMSCAIDAVNAECGYFVPVSDAYLRRKMRHSQPPVVLSAEQRIEMLQAMCLEERMKVSEKEIGTIEPRTLLTLKSFKEEFPEHKLYFIMGDDKLELLSHLAEAGAFFEISNVILYSRNSEGIEEKLKRHEKLSAQVDSIVVLPQPEGAAGISSSLVRERMLLGESSRELLVPAVWEIFKELEPDDFPDTINAFKGECDFLNNRYGCSFVYEGIEYNNAEAAFQASKCGDEDARRVVSRLSADKAAVRGSSIIPYCGWEEKKLEIMTSILEEKFGQNPTLMKKLLDTGNRVLINGNNRHETYWGIDLYGWTGENNLGKILMTIRDKEKVK
ncbi:MAG: DUF1768 domain-containing protein [Bacteroidaceae bacterium]|nr:DUF1768 domain-containing protein [Bacteroidaceae bacterium]